MAKQKKKEKYFEAVGRRKSATARVRLHEDGNGSIIVNETVLKEYFQTEPLQIITSEAFETAEVENKFRTTVQVRGGGLSAQAEAIRLGVARAIILFDESKRDSLKQAGFLRRDPREKERKKFGLKKARKSAQWSKR